MDMDTFDDFHADGTSFYQGMPNVFGGSNIYHNGELVQSTMPNIFGGEDIYDDTSHLMGQTMTNIFGAEDYYSYNGNVEEMLTQQDPLLHANDCQFPHLNL